MAQKNADIVFVLDATATMGVFIDRFRRDFLPEFTQRIVEKSDAVSDKTNVRYKVIIFRDYGTEGESAIKQSKFFRIPDETEELNHTMLYIEAGGGGDSPENGLEAIYYALTSDFAEGEGSQTVFFFTDADAVALGKRKDCAGYPEDMVDEEGLKSLWLGKTPSRLTQQGKRMIMLAPEGTAYSRIAKEMDKIMFIPTVKSGNLNDIDLASVLKMLF